MASRDREATQHLSKSEATRTRIIAAAGNVLSDVGYKHTRLSAIAAEAGIQTGSLYYYFDSKDQLVEEALDSGVRMVHARVRDAVDAVGDDATDGERLFTAIRTFVQVRLEIGSISTAHIRSYRDLPDDLRDRLRPELSSFSALWDRLVLSAVDSGEIRDDIDPYTLHLFVVHTSAQISKWPSSLRTSIPEAAETMTRLMLTGIATTNAT